MQDVYIRSRVSPSGDSIHVDIVSPDLVTLETVSSGNTVSILQSRVVIEKDAAVSCQSTTL